MPVSLVADTQVVVWICADPGDRIIVATAEVLRVPLVSADGKVSAMTSGPVVW